MGLLRLIVDTPRSATFNMAIDEMLMESQRTADAVPTLRFYSWESPACSVGYFQNVGGTAARLEREKKSVDIVRRPTGGGRVMHGRDLTFSLTMKIPSPWLGGDVKSSYLSVNQALREGLRELYPDIEFADCQSLPSGRASAGRICFESPACYDLLLNGRKVVGASQRRRFGALLHQSTIFLEENPEILIRKILSGFERHGGTRFQERPLSAGELEAARERERERYLSPDWSFRALAPYPRPHAERIPLLSRKYRIA